LTWSPRYSIAKGQTARISFTASTIDDAKGVMEADETSVPGGQ
jgi:hypothetical protein